jgi:hypothetical protein
MQFSEQDYYEHALIKPLKDLALVDSSKYTRIIVDSRVRNKTLFPNPNDYEVPFEDDINDVVSAKLIYIDVPMPQYLINNNFNKLYFKVSSTNYIATIANGDYSPSDLATAIATALNAVLPATFQVTYNQQLDNFKINATVPFTLTFKDIANPLNQLLGFAEQIYSSVTDTATPSFPNLVASVYRRNFSYNDYIIMDIEQFDLLKSIDRDLNKSFAIIPRNYSNVNMYDDLNIIKNFSPPLARMTKLRIKFFDRFGNAYDFHNMDHRFELLMTSTKQKRKYMQ